MPEPRISLKKQRIRRFFLNLDTSKKKDVEEIHDDIAEEGLCYIQMKLPLSKITEEFESKIKEKVEKNFLKANIRKATVEDLESVIAIHNRAWLTAHTPFSPLTIETLRKIYDYPDTVILVAKVYGSDSGFILLDFEGPNKEYGVIAGLGIIPRFQRRGLGKILGMAAWTYFKERNIKELRCEVYIDNLASYNFIKSIGFEEFDKKVYRLEDFNFKED